MNSDLTISLPAIPDFTVTVSEADQARARSDIAKGIEELRDTGAHVQVVQDCDVFVVLYVTPSNGPTLPMLIDPLGVHKRIRAEYERRTRH